MNKDQWEVLSAGEMRSKFNLTAENRPVIQLNPTNVPKILRPLISLAERFGISDDLIRDDFVAKTSDQELQALKRTIKQHEQILEDWLAGPESKGPQFSEEYVAFTCMMKAADGC